MNLEMYTPPKDKEDSFKNPIPALQRKLRGKLFCNF